MVELPNPADFREPDYPIEALFTQRWSPRAMSGEPITELELMTLFEAARWAPSTYNEQEWRFLYAHRDEDDFETFLGLLVEANRSWCRRAGVLLVVLSHKFFQRNQKPNPVHTLDAGMATQNLLLQAAAMQLVGHGMAGFDRDQARGKLDVPDEFAVECMIAIGRPGNPDELAPELREREKPSGRHPVSDFARAGQFSFSR